VAESVAGRDHLPLVARRVDVTRRAEVEELMDGVVRDFGSLDVLVNSAGTAFRTRPRTSPRRSGTGLFPHHTGHGVGFRYHESRPQLVPGSGHVLAENMVIATEPGVYGEELRGGFRHEDDAVVTPDGAVPLVTTGYGLET
jgi:NAD(P)-dependent dehydrogenase (short-subunit alcohol dehydrogenase family)